MVLKILLCSVQCFNASAERTLCGILHGYFCCSYPATQCNAVIAFNCAFIFLPLPVVANPLYISFPACSTFSPPCTFYLFFATFTALSQLGGVKGVRTTSQQPIRLRLHCTVYVCSWGCDGLFAPDCMYQTYQMCLDPPGRCNLVHWNHWLQILALFISARNQLVRGISAPF